MMDLAIADHAKQSPWYMSMLLPLLHFCDQACDEVEEEKLQ
jgi:hypothetical protein